MLDFGSGWAFHDHLRIQMLEGCASSPPPPLLYYMNSSFGGIHVTKTPKKEILSFFSYSCIKALEQWISLCAFHRDCTYDLWSPSKVGTA